MTGAVASAVECNLFRATQRCSERPPAAQRCDVQLACLARGPGALLELPVAVGEQVRLPALEHHLLAVVLRSATHPPRLLRRSGALARMAAMKHRTRHTCSAAQRCGEGIGGAERCVAAGSTAGPSHLGDPRVAFVDRDHRQRTLREFSTVQFGSAARACARACARATCSPRLHTAAPATRTLSGG